MSGEKDYVKQKMDTIQKALDEYEKSLGLPDRKNCLEKHEYSKYFDIKNDEIVKMDAKDCALAQYRLAQYNFYLQRNYNYELSRLTWAKDLLDELVVDDITNISYIGKHEIKINIIAKQNSVVKKVLKFVSFTQQRCDRLFMLSKNIQMLWDSLDRNRMVKISNEKY